MNALNRDYRYINLKSSLGYRLPDGFVVSLNCGPRLFYADQSIDSGGRFNLPAIYPHITPNLNGADTDRRPDRIPDSVIRRRSDFEYKSIDICPRSSKKSSQTGGAESGVISEAKACAGSSPAGGTKFAYTRSVMRKFYSPLFRGVGCGLFI